MGCAGGGNRQRKSRHRERQAASFQKEFSHSMVILVGLTANNRKTLSPTGISSVPTTAQNTRLADKALTVPTLYLKHLIGCAGNENRVRHKDVTFPRLGLPSETASCTIALSLFALIARPGFNNDASSY